MEPFLLSDGENYKNPRGDNSNFFEVIALSEPFVRSSNQLELPNIPVMTVTGARIPAWVTANEPSADEDANADANAKPSSGARRRLSVPNPDAIKTFTEDELSAQDAEANASDEEILLATADVVENAASDEAAALDAAAANDIDERVNRPCTRRSNHFEGCDGGKKRPSAVPASVNMEMSGSDDDDVSSPDGTPATPMNPKTPKTKKN